MAEKRDHTAKLNAAKLGQYVSDEQARRMIDTRGESSIFIVRAQHGPFVTDIDGSQSINLLPGAIALVPKEYEDKLDRLLKAIVLRANPGETFEYDEPGDAGPPQLEKAAEDLPDPSDPGWSGDPAEPAPSKPAKKTTAAKKTPAKKTPSGGLSAVPDAD